MFFNLPLPVHSLKLAIIGKAVSKNRTEKEAKNTLEGKAVCVPE